MPLRCIDEHGATVEAPSCSEQEWTVLRSRARRERHLRMPYCPAQAVLKTSRLGTRFFSHKAKSACDWKPETEVHLYLKALGLRAAREAGWQAETEASGTTPNGEHWTADVFARKGEARIVLEIQWSVPDGRGNVAAAEALRALGRARDVAAATTGVSAIQ